jgi:hypothetical protein
MSSAARSFATAGGKMAAAADLCSGPPLIKQWQKVAHQTLTENQCVPLPKQHQASSWTIRIFVSALSGPGREFSLREAGASGVAMRLHGLVVVETVSFVMKLGSTTP